MRAIMAGKMGDGKVAATVGRPMAMVGANHLAIHGEDAKVKAGQREKTAKRKAPKIVSVVLGTLPYHWNSLTRRRFFFESAQGLLFLRRCSVERVPVQEGF